MKENKVQFWDCFCIMCLIAGLTVIASAIFENLYFFYIDNPSVLMMGKGGYDALMQHMTHNARVDFMYDIILFLSVCIFGNSPLVHYFVQYFAYVVTCFFTVCITKECTNRLRVATGCASLLFFISPLSENLFTIGKKEIFLTLGIVLFIWSFDSLLEKQNTKIQKIKWSLLYFFSIFFSLTLKETSYIVLLPGILFLLYCVFLKKDSLKKAIIYFCVLCFVIACIRVYKMSFIKEVDYTDYVLTLQTVINNIIFYFKYHLDLFILGIVGLICDSILFLFDKKNLNYVKLLIFNLTGWGYFGGMCLWRWSQSYYLYPAAVLFVISLGGLFCIWRNKVINVLKFCLVLGCMLYGGLYNYCIATSHMDLGKVYTNSIFSIYKNIEVDNKVMIDNAQLYEEPVVQMRNLVVGYLNKPMFIVGGLQNIVTVDVPDDRLALYGYSRELYEEEKENINLRVGDYVVHYINDRNFHGPIRGVNPAITVDFIEILSNQNYEFKMIDAEEISRSYWGVEGEKWGFHDMRAGYAIYRVEKVGCSIWGMTPDGWSGNEVIINNYQGDCNGVIHIQDIGSVINGFEKNVIVLYIDNEFIKELEVERGDIIKLNDYFNDFENKSIHSIRMKIKKVFVPTDYSLEWGDDRSLGINMLFENM